MNSASIAELGRTLTPPEALAEADRLADAGRFRDAVGLLTQVNLRTPRPGLEVRLIDLRMEAARRLEPGPGRSPWPPRYSDPFVGQEASIPEVDARDLTPDLLGGAVAHHGSLIVRGAFDTQQVESSREAIDRADARRADSRTSVSPQDRGWYRQADTGGDVATAVERKMVGEQGGTWLADSPTATFRILAKLEEIGIIDTVAGHLGERPYFSLQKSTLRRSAPDWNYVAWHQDGSFLGDDVRTMNIWVALSPCGGDLPTPGLEFVPRRFDHLLPIDPAWSKHAIAFDAVDEVLVDTPSVIPHFEPGDAIMFDQMCVHRTHLPAEMAYHRYALECWFFAPSHQSPGYTPLFV